MPRLTVLALLSVGCISFGALAACEQRYSGDAPAAAPSNAPASSDSAGLASVLALAGADAGPTGPSATHAMIVTNCGWPSHPCAGLESSAPEEGGSYRVVFGSGHASVRSRGQAMSDLYREMRDKTSAGQILDIEARNPAAGDGGVVSPSGTHGGGSDDPISRASFAVLDIVDAIGEAAVDVLYTSGTDECAISLGRGVHPDGGATQCLVREPDRPKRLQMGTGLSW